MHLCVPSKISAASRTFEIMISLLQLLLMSFIYETNCYKFLVLHPMYSGSHVLTIHRVSLELIKRGHNVTTLRYKDQHELQLKTLGQITEKNLTAGTTRNANVRNMKFAGQFREIQRGMNNSDGMIPYLTLEEEAKFVMPSELLWSESISLSNLFRVPKNPWQTLKGRI